MAEDGGLDDEVTCRVTVAKLDDGILMCSV